MSSCSDPERPDTDDTDSQYSFSNTSSPSQDVHDSSSQDFTSLQSQTAGDLKVQMQVQDMFPLKGSNKKSNAHITKQMMQETLMDEGLRVVKELSSQIKEEPDMLTSTPSNMPLGLSVSPAGSGGGSGSSNGGGGTDGLTVPMAGLHHQQQQHHHHHQQQHHNTHPHHHSPSQLHQSMQSYRYPNCNVAIPPPNVNIGGNGVGLGGNNNGTGVGGCCTPNGTSMIGRGDRDCRPPSSNGQGPDNNHSNSSDVEKAAASTINALLSLSQNAGRGMKHEYSSPSTCPKSD